MPNIIKNIDELKANFSAIDANFNWSSIKSFVEDAENEIVSGTIGDETLLFFQNSTDLEGEQLKAFQLLSRGVSYLAVLKWSETAIFRLTDKALYVAKSTDGVIISDKKLRDLRTHCEETGFKFLDKTITVMELNPSLFPEYEQSEIRQNFLRGFIKTAKDFSLQRDINNSRITFLSIFAIMIDVQDRILPHVMGDDYYTVFREKFRTGDLSTAENRVLPLIKKAVALLTIAQACLDLPVKLNSNGLFINRFNSTSEYDQRDPADAARAQYLSEDHRDKGERKLAELKLHLVKYAADLPGYVAPVAEEINYNSQDSGLYLM